MKITIDANAKEVAELLVEVRTRRENNNQINNKIDAKYKELDKMLNRHVENLQSLTFDTQQKPEQKSQ